MKILNIPGIGRMQITTCFGLPLLAAVGFASIICYVVWSYWSPPVGYNSVKMEQIGRNEFVTLRLTKDVTWSRLYCSGTTEESLTPTIASENPKKVSSSPLKLDVHIILPPKPGESTHVVGTRSVVLSSGQVGAGRYKYKICARMSCGWAFWEYVWPIDSGCAETAVDIN